MLIGQWRPWPREKKAEARPMMIRVSNFLLICFPINIRRATPQINENEQKWTSNQGHQQKEETNKAGLFQSTRGSSDPSFPHPKQRRYMKIMHIERQRWL